MSNCKHLFKTSVGKKFLVGITGIAISGFAVLHMSGNLFLLVGPEAYNHYAYALNSNPLLPVAEIGLLLCFLVHIGLAINLTLANRAANPSGYIKTPGYCEKGATFASRTMIYTGLLMLVFLILHLITFKYGPNYPTTENNVEIRDLYRLVAEKFQNPLYVAWYLFALFILGLHLSHGLAAVFQTLGFAGVRTPAIRKSAMIFAWVLVLGFMSQPIVLFLRR
jgi:succinate dehydrogenase / fumarate reductase, cytochrome b subunit